jgi:hypothetical protein
LHKWSSLYKNGHLSAVASLEETESDIFSAEVYPNPAKESINIALFANNPTDVKIFDNKGSLVKVIAQSKSGIIRENINKIVIE